MSSLYPVKKPAPEQYTTEFDILKASLKFLRSDDEDVAKSWNAQLAKKYEATLFKEFAVCDLKHYKSGNIALRWRTEDEVLSGAGESSCGNTRCHHHGGPSEATPGTSQDAPLKPPKPPKLTTMELPFSYVEQGETELREVLVKVVLCERCVKKITWKREKAKKIKEEGCETPSRANEERLAPTSASDSRSGKQTNHRHGGEDKYRRLRDRRRSRSRSPRRYPQYPNSVPEG